VRRLLVAIAGPTGVIYGIRLLERLRDVPDLTRHLVLTEPARRAIPSETEYAVADVHELADHVSDAAAARLTAADGMVIAPCDVATAAAMVDIGPASAPNTEMASAPDIGSAAGADPGHDLVLRTAAEILARGRPLIVLVHQSPLGVDHLRCLLRLTERGAVILPPVPAFYNRPQGIEDIVLHTVARVIDRLGLPQSFAPEWRGSQLRT
jgi:4-hydroxy-3-polyprenylbenzoate decarboxylase